MRAASLSERSAEYFARAAEVFILAPQKICSVIIPHPPCIDSAALTKVTTTIIIVLQEHCGCDYEHGDHVQLSCYIGASP